MSMERIGCVGASRGRRTCGLLFGGGRSTVLMNVMAFMLMMATATPNTISESNVLTSLMTALMDE